MADFVLTSEAKAALAGDDRSRLQWLQADWMVHTPESRLAWQWMERLARSPRTTRPACLHIIGKANTGKTTILREFFRRHCVQPLPGEDLVTARPVILVDAFSSGRVAMTGLHDAVLKGLWPKASEEKVWYGCSMETGLTRAKVKVILVDEAGELLSHGPREHLRLLSELRRITHQFGINIVAATTDALANAFDQDPQLKTRFRRRILLDSWRLSQNFRNFLYGIEQCLPFPTRSYLDQKAIVDWLLRNLECSTGEVVETVKLASEYALASGAKCITLEHLKCTLDGNAPPQFRVEPGSGRAPAAGNERIAAQGS